MSTTNHPDPRVTKIEDNGVTFQVLTLDDIEQVETACRRTIMQCAAELADVSGLIGTEKFGSISSLVPEQIGLQHIYDFAFSAKGVRCILRISLDRAGIPADQQAEIIARYQGYNGFNMALAVMGYMRRMTPEEIAAELHRRAMASMLPEEPKKPKPDDEDEGGADSPPVSSATA